ncbi:MAG: putative aminopeptidase [Thermoleophilia bacterium]|nr:putative aminopeptidase [Thermoleophilia bacterium]
MVSRRRPVDFVGWRLYRRAMVVPVLALLVLLVTSFRAEVPVQGALPPTLANEQAAALLDDGAQFRKLFPTREPGSPGSIDSAQWMLDEFKKLDLPAKTVPATTVDPATDKSVGLVNVEATLPGRTRELVVIHAHRDTAAEGRGADALGQVALLALARELKSTRDLRRTYLFVSTDGATLNGGGARALANRLSHRGAVVAVIGIDRLGAGGALRVDASPSAEFAPPLGLVRAATGSVDAEGGDPSIGGVMTQVARLAAPVTLREHGQLLARGLPALTVTAGDDQLRTSGDTKAAAVDVGAGVRAVQRLVGTLEQVDQLQSAGKTWVASERRVYRGWALKIFVASLLIPVWLAAVDMLVRHRRGWNLAAAVGTAARSMLAGIAAVAALWVLAGFGLLPGSGDRPPNPGTLDDVRVFTLLVWGLIVAAAWLLARGPDWRRQRQASRRAAIGPDTPELVVAVVGLVIVSVLALAVSPYTVLFIVPALHVWMCIPSWRIVFSPRRATLVWAAGLVGPLLALIAVGARSDTGLGAGWFAMQLVQTRTIPPMLALLIGCGGGLLGLLLVASRGRVAHPALPVIVTRWTALRDGDAGLLDLTPRGVRALATELRSQALRLRVPSRGSARTSPSRARVRENEPKAGYAPDAATRARQRAAARTASRSRVKSR